MTEIHIVIRRINPALKIDLAQVGCIKDCQFVPLPSSAVANSPAASYLKSSSICDSLYVDHSDLSGLISACSSLPDFRVEFFDNTIILMFNLDSDYDESTSEEEGKGN